MDIRSTGNNPSPVSQPPQQSVVLLDFSVPLRLATPIETATAVREPEPAVTMLQLSDAVTSLNKAMQEQSQNLEFSIDTDSNRTIVKLIDQNTKEVLRQIPTVETLEIAKALAQTTGLLIQQRV